MKNYLKRIISTVLIVAMIITNAGFATLADSAFDIVNTSEDGNNIGDLSHKYYDELSNENEDIRVNDLITSTNSDMDSNKTSTNYEKEEDETDDENTATDSEVENTNENTSINSDEDVATDSDVDMVNLDVATDSDVDTATIDIATDSEIEVIATDSVINIEVVDPTNLATKNETTLPNQEPFGAWPNTIWLGTYPQNDEDGIQLEPIKWRVLSNGTNEVLLLADSLLDNLPFHNVDGASITWGGSSIRSWLNDTFKTKAFEQIQYTSGIVDKIITTDGSNTQDRVFLLDRSTAESMAGDSARQAKGTAFAKGPNSANGQLHVSANGFTYYWLRNRGSNAYYASHVNENGVVYLDGAYVYYGDFGVRPAIYADKSFTGFRSSNNSVTWNLGTSRFATYSQMWLDFDAYQGGQKLPDGNNMMPKTGYTFKGWHINNSTDLYTSIPENQTGDITLSPEWQEVKYIWMGVYPQSDETGTQLEPIKWRILRNDGNEMFLIADSILDNVSYHNTSTDIAWVDSSMRNWLNNTFKTKAFSQIQIDTGIVDKVISTSGGQNITDKITLLNYQQALDMGSDGDRCAKATAFAKGANSVNGSLDVRTSGIYRGNAGWLLSERGYAALCSCYVQWNGYAFSSGVNVRNKNYGARPAFYANLQSIIFQSTDRSVTWQMNGNTFKSESTLWSQMDTYVGGQQLPNSNNLTEIPGQTFAGWRINNSYNIYKSIPENQTGPITLSPVWGVVLRQGWYNSTYATSSITNINFVNAPEPSDPSTYDERFVMNATDGAYAYRTGNVVNIYGSVIKGLGSWEGIFAGFTNLTSIDFTMVDVSDVTSMKSLFENCSSLNTITFGTNFSIASISDISRMFKSCTNLQSVDFGSIKNTKNVTTIESIFENCTSLTTLTGTIATLSSLQVAKNAFKGCLALSEFRFNVCDTPTLIDVSGMFDGCTSLTTIYADDDFAGLPAGVTSSTDMFKSCNNLKGGEGFSYNVTAPITDGSVANIDYGGIKPGYFTIQDTSKYGNARFTLPNDWYDEAVASKPKSAITKIKFYNDAAGVGVYDSNYYMSNIDGTRFYIDGSTVKIHYGHNIPKLKVQGDWSGFFKDFTNLTSIEGLDKIDTSNVTSMKELFKGCAQLQSIALGDVNIKDVSTIESAFENCVRLTTFTGNIASFSNLTSAKNAFKGCASLTTFRFDVCDAPTLTDVSGMFADCSNLTRIYADDNFTGLSTGANSTNMFLNCTKLVGGQGFVYNSVDVDAANGNKYANVDYGGIKPGYFTLYGTEEQLRQKYANTKFNLPSTWFDGATVAGINKDDVTKIKFYDDVWSGANTGIGYYDGSYVMSTAENTLGYYENEKDASGNPTGKYIVKIHFGHSLPSLKVGTNFSAFFKDFKNIKTVEGLDKLNLSDVENMSELFSGCEKLENIMLTSNISHAKNMEKMFYNCKNLTTVELGPNVNLGQVETLESAFENCEKLTSTGLIIRSTVPFSHIRSFKNAFKNCKALTTYTVDTGNASTLINIEGVFSGCENLTTVNATNLNLTKVESAKEAFNDCKKLTTLALGNNSNLATVSNLEKMFYNCEKLTSLPGIHITSNRIATMKSMFSGCVNLVQVGMMSAKTSNLVYDGLVDMFYNCKKLTAVAFGTDFVLGNATDLTNMFNGCEELKSIDLSNFSSNSITNVTDMFKNNNKLTTIIASSSFAIKGKTGNEMFLGCVKLEGGKGTKYNAASVSSIYACVDEGINSANPGYFTWGDPTITFMPGEGATGTMNPITGGRGTTITANCGFTRAGYTFKNWVDEFGTTYGVNITISRSMTLTATWEKIPDPTPTPIPTPTPTPRPTPRPSGGGGSTGGGSGSKDGGSIVEGREMAVNFFMQTPIYDNEYTWIHDLNGRKIGALLNANSTLGKAMISSARTKGTYELSQNGKSLKLASGIYKIYENGVEHYYGFDKYGNMITGFVETSTNTKILTVASDTVSLLTNIGKLDDDKVFYEYNGLTAKFYLYEDDGPFRGQLWKLPIIVHGVKYVFDASGQVISSSDIPSAQGVWEYNPVENVWRFFAPDPDGQARYYKNIALIVSYQGETCQYIFDEKGNLMTGYFNWNGNNYYGQESGLYKGAATMIY